MKKTISIALFGLIMAGCGSTVGDALDAYVIADAVNGADKVNSIDISDTSSKGYYGYTVSKNQSMLYYIGADGMSYYMPIQYYTTQNGQTTYLVQDGYGNIKTLVEDASGSLWWVY